MLILGIIFTGVGILILQWYATHANGPSLNRPVILNKPISVLLINIFSFSFLVAGLILLWKVNHTIVLLIVPCFLALSFYGSFLKSEKERLKRFFKIYKMLKIQKPTVEEKSIIAEALLIYIKQCRKKEYSLAYHGLSEAGVLDETVIFRYIGISEDVKEVASNLLRFEKSNLQDFSSSSDEKESLRRERNISKAYKEVFN
ncbi:MAG: hypothetical protein AABZ65_07615 [Candidatus Omnitrophota bacterium]